MNLAYNHANWVQFGVWIAYALVAYCYFGVGFAGYHAFGSATGSQIMYSLGHPVWVVCVAEIMIIVHVCGSFQACHHQKCCCRASVYLVTLLYSSTLRLCNARM